MPRSNGTNRASNNVLDPLLRPSPSAFALLPSAFDPSAFALPPSAFDLLPLSCCLLPSTLLPLSCCLPPSTLLPLSCGLLPLPLSLAFLPFCLPAFLPCCRIV